VIKLVSAKDPRLRLIPPEYRPAVERALETLASVFGRDPDPGRDGFVGYVEGGDTCETVRRETGRDLRRMEGVFRDGPCLVGVLLWGNAGAGVTLVCPDKDGYAPEVVSTMRKHLPADNERSPP
jgi:hypothetical protein